MTGKRVHVAASPHLSNEALFLLSEIIKASNGSGGFNVETGPEAPLPAVADLSLRSDRAPNVNGAELLGFVRSDSPLSGMQPGDVLIIADNELENVSAGDLDSAAGIIVVGTTLPDRLRQADVVLPIGNFAEEEGTFTNIRGRVQRFLQAKAAPGMARPSWAVLADLVSAIGGSANYMLPGDVFDALANSHSKFSGLSYDTLGLRGLPVIDQQLVGAGSE